MGTSIDPDSFTVPSIGAQPYSNRKSLPSFSCSKVGREQANVAFVTKQHLKLERIGRESPVNARYNLKSTLDGPKISFTKGKQNNLNALPPPPGLDSNDELAFNIDSQPFKFRRDPSHIIGTDARGQLKDAALLKNHQAAFFGRASPGPAAIGADYGPDWRPTKPRTSPAGPFGAKSKLHWLVVSDTPAEVGPGVYPCKDVAIGNQQLSKRRTQPVNQFSHSAKFPKGRNADQISILDAAPSCLGKQALNKNRSEPRVSFGSGTRNSRSKTACCMTENDMGPLLKASMPRPSISMPTLPRA